jgi:outer membrane protein assembly factor BamB
MSRIALFCPTCSTYCPAGFICPGCQRTRGLLETPVEPGQPLWRTTLPGAAAGRLALAQVGGRRLLLAAWSQAGRGRTPDGGVIALDVADGSIAWRGDLGLPAEGGAAVASEAGVAVVGLAQRGLGPGEGWAAGLDLGSGQVRWRTQLGGMAEAAPAMDEARVYAAAGDGQLTCLDARTGSVVWRRSVADAAARIPATPALVAERGAVQAIIVGTYSVTAWRDEGKLAAFDTAGRRLWLADAGGQVRGTPAVLGRRVYVAAYRSNPSAGVLTAFDSQTGKPLWPAPFTVPAADARSSAGFVAAALAHGDTVYAGCQDHRLYAVDAATGVLRWSHEVGGGIASAPAWVAGLVVVGANDGMLYAVDAETGARAWEIPLGGHVLTAPLIADGTIFAAADDGTVVALPWHAGRYAWAAERLEAAKVWSEAGDCRALAAHFHGKPDERDALYRQAAADFAEAGEMEKAGQMWTALGARWRREAAEAWQRAGLALCDREPDRAGRCFQRAAELFYALYTAEPLGPGSEALAQALNACTRSLAECAGLPYLTARLDNADGLVQWEPCKLNLRLVNQGRQPVQQEIRLTLGGGFAELMEAKVLGDLAPKGTWRVPLLATATRPTSLLEGEIEYDSGDARYGLLRTVLVQPIQAQERPRPVNVTIGDVARLELKLASATTPEGATIQLITQDVGAIVNRGAIASLDVQGDVGYLKGAEPALVRAVEELSRSVAEAAGRLARIETAQAAGATSAEEITALRRTVEGFRGQYEELHGQLAAEQRAGLRDIAVELGQMTDQLDALDAGQTALRGDLAGMREALLARLDTGERTILAGVVAQLNRRSLADVEAVTAALQTEGATQAAVAELNAAIAELHRRMAELPAAVATQLAQVEALSTGTQLDVKHKLVAEIPIIPFVLTYQGEFELEDGLRLAELWRQVVAKVRGRR